MVGIVAGGVMLLILFFLTERTLYLQRLGYRVMRYWNHDVLQSTEAVLEHVRTALFDRSPHPHPLPGGEGTKRET